MPDTVAWDSFWTLWPTTFIYTFDIVAIFVTTNHLTVNLSIISGAIFEQGTDEVQSAFKFAMLNHNQNFTARRFELHSFVDVINTADAYKLSHLSKWYSWLIVLCVTLPEAKAIVLTWSVMIRKQRTKTRTKYTIFHTKKKKGGMGNEKMPFNGSQWDLPTWKE